MVVYSITITESKVSSFSMDIIPLPVPVEEKATKNLNIFFSGILFSKMSEKEVALFSIF